MQISWKELNRWVAAPKPTEVGELLTKRGIEVEAIEDQSAGLEHVVVAKILDMAKHPEADRLTLCGVTFGGERSEIVCGAKNMKVGDHVALALPGAKLPNGAKIEKSKIRGVTSNGMLCSEVELGLAAESDGILILPGGSSAPTPGEAIVKVLGRDDAILHLKPTANRADCLGALGIAREVSAALGVPLKRPEGTKLTFATDAALVKTEDVGCPEFLVCRVSGVTVGASPSELARAVEGFGSRSINNVVDCANLVMFEYGHPVHTYDASHVAGALAARLATPGEKLVLLDGKEIRCEAGELVIADSKGVLALAGVMGGKSSEVTTSTKELLLEVAVFDRKAVRRSSKKHQLRTDAASRFERGIDATDGAEVMGRLAKLLEKYAGGKVQKSARAGKGVGLRSFEVSAERMAALLAGSAVSSDTKKQITILKGLEIQVSESGKKWKVTVPGHRSDLEITEDLAEEVVRTVGFESFETKIPTLSDFPRLDPKFELIQKTKRVLSGLGLNEAISYAFISRATLKKYSKAWAEQAVGIANPMSEDQEALVPSLLPGLMNALQTTRSHQFGSQKSPIGFFEVRPVFSRAESVTPGKTVTGVNESDRVAILLAGSAFESAFSTEDRSVDARDLTAAIETVLEALHFRGWKVKQGEALGDVDSVFHPGAKAGFFVGKQRVGVFGEITPALLGAMKVRDRVFYAELEMAPIWARSLEARENVFKAPTEHPPGERDFAFLVPEGVAASAITELLKNEGKPLVESAFVFDRYVGDPVPKGMTSLALRVIFSVEGRSPSDAEIDNVVARMLTRSQEVLGVKLRDR